MKSEKAREYIIKNVLPGNGRQDLISATDGAIAATIAEQEVTEKAIKSACDLCIDLTCGCGHIDRDPKAYLECEELEKFRNELNNRL